MPQTHSRARGRKGFQRTGTLLKSHIRQASSSRGFAQSELLTQWHEIAGPDMAQICRPVEVSYARGGMGATLVLLTTGAQAPLLEMQKETLRERVNTVYGYNAISRIRITQTAATGFAEGQVDFEPAVKGRNHTEPNPQARHRIAPAVKPVRDESLRNALETLGAHIISRQDRKKDPS